MGSTADTEVVCPHPHLEFNDKQKDLAFWILAISTVYIPLGLGWWFLRRKKFELRKRNGRLVAVSAIGVYFHVFVTCFVNWKGQDTLPCDIHAFLAFLVVPLCAGPLAVRIFLINNKIKYSQLLAARAASDRTRGEVNGVFQGDFRRATMRKGVKAFCHYLFERRQELITSKSPNRPKHSVVYSVSLELSDQQIQSQLPEDFQRSMTRTKYRAIPREELAALHFAQSFWFSFAVLAFFLVLGVCAVLYQFIKPDTPYGHGCKGCTLSTVDFSVFSGLFFILEISVGVVLYKVRKHTSRDPLKIKRELSGVLLCGLVVLGATIVCAVDPNQVRMKGSFDWMYIASVTSLVYFTVICVIPVFTTYRRQNQPSAVDLVRFDEVMKTTYGKRQFAKYLATEFSLENLYFYDSVNVYTGAFDAQSPQRNAEMAQEIIETFIVDGSMLQVNISHSIRKSIQDIFSSGQQVPRNLFDRAFGSVLSLMELDSYPRFQKSAAFQIVQQEVSVNTTSSLPI